MSKLENKTAVSRADAAPHYSDFFSDFSNHPQTGNLNKKLNAEAVKQSVKMLLLTNRYERLFQPDIGGNLNSLLFSNITPRLEMELSTMINDCINNFEPRATLLDTRVAFNPDRNQATVTIKFAINKIEDAVEFDIFLDRSR